MKTLRDSLVLVLLAVIIATYTMGASFGAGIKSVQQGTGTESVATSTTDTVNITITTVDLSKSVVDIQCSGGGAASPYICGYLQATTNLRIFVSHSSGSTQTVNYTWQVIEYY